MKLLSGRVIDTTALFRLHKPGAELMPPIGKEQFFSKGCAILHIVNDSQVLKAHFVSPSKHKIRVIRTGT
jgi:hypothetical protein